jgi:phenylpropionate dioxygenase-like ring-hydroxylating dioxygenase large terminal subunit
MSRSTSKLAAGLRGCWHPVGYSRDLKTVPLSTTLLGESLVLWRDSKDVPHAFVDLCIHRGTALSLGCIQRDEIVCPYHGWRYGKNGACTAIPQLPDPSAVPMKAKVATYYCIEQYGMIWVALEEARWPLPKVPELESTSWRQVHTGPFQWASNSSRQVENFTDFGHFPFVHPGLLGDPERCVVPPYAIHTESNVLYYDITRPEAPNGNDFPVFANPDRTTPERRSRYQLHLPYTIILRLGWGGDCGMVYLFSSQPVSVDLCIGYCVVARNYNLQQLDYVLQDFEAVIFSQDQRIVESQRPEQVPFDLAAELHMRFDAVAVAYRRAMRAAGLS